VSGPGDAAMAVEQSKYTAEQRLRSGADLQAFTKQVVETVNRIVPDMQLRQWCVEQANKTTFSDHRNVVELAHLIYTFVTAPIGKKTD